MDQAPLYDQFLLLGDSITEFGECHGGEFGFAAALRDGQADEAGVMSSRLTLLQRISDDSKSSIEASGSHNHHCPMTETICDAKL